MSNEMLRNYIWHTHKKVKIKLLDLTQTDRGENYINKLCGVFPK